MSAGARGGRRCAMVLGASGGLGTELTVQALERDFDVWAYNREGLVGWGAPEPERVLALDLADRTQVDSVALPDAEDLTVLWVAGFFVKGPLPETHPDEIASAIAVMFHHPLLLLRRLLARRRRAIHLVTVASSSSWKARELEVVYCAVKAAQATATRQALADLARAADTARVTLVQPGGLAVPNFHGEYANNIGQMLDVSEVASLIWAHAAQQEDPFSEMQVLRTVGASGAATPDIHFGPRAPEAPRTCIPEERHP